MQWRRKGKRAIGGDFCGIYGLAHIQYPTRENKTYARRLVGNPGDGWWQSRISPTRVPLHGAPAMVARQLARATEGEEALSGAFRRIQVPPRVPS